MRLTTADARRDALAKVPTDARGLAEDHVRIWTDRHAWAEAERILRSGRDLHGRRAAIAALPPVLQDPVKAALARMWSNRHGDKQQTAGNRGGVR